MDLRRKVKGLVGRALIRTGLWDRFLRTRARRHEAVVLTYHRVIEKWDRTLDYSQPGMVVTAETFDRQLEFLKKYFHIVPLSSLLNSTLDTRHSTLLERPSCAITFDDGWRDNYEIAFPILRKHGVSATIFLTTDFIGTDRAFWHTELTYVLLHGVLSHLTKNQALFQSYPARVRYHLMQLAHMAEVPRAHHVDPVVEAVKEGCDQETITKLIMLLADALGICRPFFPTRRFFLDWNQVRQMATSGVEIGSHGCSHQTLTRLKAWEAEEELVRSKAEIEGRIGQAVQHFAFPHGAANRDLMALPAKAGYRTACVCTRGSDQGGVTSLVWRRLGMHEGASGGCDGFFSEAGLLLWLFRAPKIKPA